MVFQIHKDIIMEWWSSFSNPGQHTWCLLSTNPIKKVTLTNSPLKAREHEFESEKQCSLFNLLIHFGEFFQKYQELCSDVNLQYNQMLCCWKKFPFFSYIAFVFTFSCFYFPSKNFFGKENIELSSRRFFSLKLPMTCRVKGCRIVGVLYNTCVGSHRGSKAVGGGFISRYRPCFYTSFQISVDTFLFFNSKILGFVGK